MTPAWESLSPGMQRALHAQGWARLWPVQEQAIRAIRQGRGNVLVAGDTASGKTEAAYLPILSDLEESGRVAGFFALGVAPLRALLNDQGDRLAALAQPVGAEVHLWHSDVSGARKSRAQNMPRGILLTTPESLESMLIHRAGHLRHLFGHLHFVVVDELHAFLGTGRGIQLHSVLARLLRYTAAPPRRIALSATLADFTAARAFLGEPVTVCAGGGPHKATRLSLRYTLGSDLADDLRRVTARRKALIFCNSRARVEALTYRLGRLARSPDAYLAHHGSLHARERARAEAAMRGGDAPRSIVCTSTMELGVDVGDCDLVVEVDCTSSVTALRQRLGRSGRRSGRSRTGQLYAGTESGLVQAIAVVELLRRGWLEPPEPAAARHDLVWHQLLAVAAERGLKPADVARAPAGLITHMLEQGHLSRAGGSLLPGPAGERLVRARDFLGVFDDAEAWDVAAGPRVLGQLPPLPIYRPGTPLILAGRLWTVVAREPVRRRLEVRPGGSAHPPVFSPSPWRVHARVREAMAEVLVSAESFPYLDARGSAALDELRAAYARLGLAAGARPICLTPDATEWHLFAGDRAAATLGLWLRATFGGSWETTPWGGLRADTRRGDLARRLADVATDPPAAVELEAAAVALVPDAALRLPKFGRYLPRDLRRDLHAARELDGAGAVRMLTGYRFPVVEVREATEAELAEAAERAEVDAEIKEAARPGRPGRAALPRLRVVPGAQRQTWLVAEHSRRPGWPRGGVRRGER